MRDSIVCIGLQQAYCIKGLLDERTGAGGDVYALIAECPGFIANEEQEGASSL